MSRALGERYLAAGGKWRPGMMNTAYKRYMGPAPGGHGHLWASPIGNETHPVEALNVFPPDFRDPATRGCLLAEVRERYDDPTLSPTEHAGAWNLSVPPAWSFRSECGEAGALVAALEMNREQPDFRTGER